jgi:MFS family permease
MQRSKVSVPQGGLMAWVVCLSAGLFFLYEFLQLNVFDVINPALRDDFHLSALALGWLSSAFLWANIIFLIPAGLLLDRWSARTVVLAAMVLCVIGTLGFASTHRFYWAFFFHALAGVGNAGCFLSCVVLVARWFPSNQQAFVIGCITTMAFAGGVIAHTPMAYLAAHYGWRHALYFDGVLGVVILLWLLWALHDKPHQTPHASSAVLTWREWLNLAVSPQIILPGLYTACMNLPIMVLCALWGASYLTQVQHLAVLDASNVVSLLLLGSMVGCPVVGWLSDYWGSRHAVMILGASVTLLLWLPFFMFTVLSNAVLCVLFFLLGFFTSTQVISYPLIAEYNTPAHTGIATAIASIIIMGGAGLAQIGFGFLMHWDYDCALKLFPVTTLVALIAILLTRRKYGNG